MPRPSVRPWLMLAALAPALAGCASSISLSDHDCLARAMYFESNRSSPDGMLAVGTTVMNRLDDPKFPKSVCAVVGQPHQFAPGVLDKPMDSRGRKLASEVADRVLSGERHPQMPSDAKFFHTAGYSFPYTNMHYVLVAGRERLLREDPRWGEPAAAAVRRAGLRASLRAGWIRRSPSGACPSVAWPGPSLPRTSRPTTRPRS